MKLSIVEKKALVTAIAERQRAEAEADAIFGAILEAHGLDPAKNYRIENDELVEVGNAGQGDVAEAVG